MEEKNVKKISLSTFFLVLSLILIIIMGIFMYKLYNDKITEIEKSAELESQVNNLNETVSNLQEKLDGVSNIVNNNHEESQAEEKSIDVNNSIVKNAYAKVEGASDTIYEYVSAQKSNLPNKIKLVLGYHNLEEGSLKSYSNDEFLQTGNSYYLPTETLKKSIEDVLGNDITFSNEDFTADRIGLSEVLTYNKQQDRYDTNFEFGGDSDYFAEKIISASVQGDYLNIYVKPVFFKLEAEKYGVSDVKNYDAYSNYNYSNDEFLNKVQEKVFDIDDIDISKLDTYKYTFLKQGDNYYFNSLQKVN